MIPPADIDVPAARDEVLRARAHRLHKTLRTSDDLAARRGGDELPIVLHGVPDLAITEKLRLAGPIG